MTNRIFIKLFAVVFFAVIGWGTAQVLDAPSVANAQSEFSCTNVTEIPQIECEALVAISTGYEIASVGWNVVALTSQKTDGFDHKLQYKCNKFICISYVLLL